MMRVIGIFQIGDKLSVTLEGTCDNVKNGSKLIGQDNKEYEVISVAMPRTDNPSDISRTTIVLMPACDIKTGYELRIA